MHGLNIRLKHSLRVKVESNKIGPILVHSERAPAGGRYQLTGR